MTEACPTVPIKTAKGFVLINESDFDPTKHEVYTVETVEAPPPPPPLPPPPPPGPLDNLPNNWRSRSPGELRTLATSITGRSPEDKRQAVEMIEAAIAAAKEPK